MKIQRGQLYFQFYTNFRNNVMLIISIRFSYKMWIFHFLRKQEKKKNFFFKIWYRGSMCIIWIRWKKEEEKNHIFFVCCCFIVLLFFYKINFCSPCCWNSFFHFHFAFSFYLFYSAFLSHFLCLSTISMCISHCVIAPKNRTSSFQEQHIGCFYCVYVRV